MDGACLLDVRRQFLIQHEDCGEENMSETQKVIYSMVRVGKTHPPKNRVLREISLSYFYGAKIGVLGLNGAGKSTLLRIMAGVDKNFEGQIQISPGYTTGF